MLVKTSRRWSSSWLRTRNLADCVGGQLNVGVEINLALVHGTETSPSFITRLERLADNRQSIGLDDQVDADISGDGRDTDDVEGQGPIVGGKGNIEERGREVRVCHAGTERRRRDDALCLGHRDEGGEEGD